jgi:hypothetical protein
MLGAARNFKTFATVKQINMWRNSAVRHDVNKSLFNISDFQTAPSQK